MARILRLVLVIAATGAFIAGAVLVVAPRTNELVNANRSEDVDIDLDQLDGYAVRSYVYASDGKQITTWHAEENRSPVTLDTVPQLVIDAVLSVEDADFYNHGGVNVKGTFRALIENVSAGDIAQGGSTLTQQLVKNAFLNKEQNFGRKSEEAAIAVRLEQKLEKLAAENGAFDPVKVAKDVILEKYLNTVYFGSSAYGVQAAAETYWGKSVQELNIADAAMMAAIIRNPTGYDPTLHPEAAKKQRQIALDRMAQIGKITKDQARLYGQLPVPTKRCVADSNDPACGNASQAEVESFFLDEVKQVLRTKETSPGVSAFGIDVTTPGFEPNDPSGDALAARAAARKKAIDEGGFRIYTTLDAQAQGAADAVLAEGFPHGTDQCLAAGLAAVEPTGAVRVLSAGAYKQPVCPGRYPPLEEVDPGDPFAVNRSNANVPNQVDFATSPYNQVGSTWKVFTLLTAFEQGNAPGDQIGGPVAIDLGKTKGRGCYDERSNRDGNQYCVDEGSGGSLDQATTSSSNSAFTRLYQVVGSQNVADLTAKLGVTNPVLQDPGRMGEPSRALGTTNVSPIEMASAYSTIPNGGVHEPYYFVDRIEDRNGRVIYEHEGSGEQVVSKQTACLATQVLLHNVQSGTGTNALLPRQPAAGKTGTTDVGADTWFVGFTPDLTTAVWMGNPYEDVDTKFVSGRENFGGQFPASMWGAFMKRYQDGRDVKQFPGCGNVRGNGSVKGKGNNQYVFGYSIGGTNNK